MITQLLGLSLIAAVLLVVSTFSPRLGTFGKRESRTVALPFKRGLAFLLVSGLGILACESSSQNLSRFLLRRSRL